jgi:hypothetical protein
LGASLDAACTGGRRLPETSIEEAKKTRREVDRTGRLGSPAFPALRLSKLSQAIETGRAAAAKTQRERDWIEALAVFFKDYDKVDLRTRTLAYEAAMVQPSSCSAFRNAPIHGRGMTWKG